MKYRKYQHIEKINREEVDGLLNGTVTVQPKIDGTCSVLWLEDGEVKAGSRKRELSEQEDNHGFFKNYHEDENIKRYLKKHPNHYLYGEYLIPHTIRTYDRTAWNKFYIFDVYEKLEDGGGRYLSYDTYKPLLEEFNLTYIPEIARLENPTIEDVAACIKQTHYLMPEGCTPEGVIAKNYAYKNKYGHTIWGKIVSEEFFNKKSRNKRTKATSKTDNANSEFEFRIAEEYITDAIIWKEYEKVKNEFPDIPRGETIGRVLNAVYDSFLHEDLYTVVRRNKKCTINFITLRHESDDRVKTVLRGELLSTTQG